MSQSLEKTKDETLSELMTQVTLLRENEQRLEAKQEETDKVVILLKDELNAMRQQLASYEERYSTVLSEINTVKEDVMNIDNKLPAESILLAQQPAELAAREVTPPSPPVKRSIPAPSKFLVEEQKKKDNRLLELRRITKEYKNVDDEEAGLRLYKLQKTMIHVVADLKKYMKSKDEDITKSWKSIDLNTQRVAFEMVEREAISLGVPLNMCIGYWGARRLISKSWANALRTSKKNVKKDDANEEDRETKKIKT